MEDGGNTTLPMHIRIQAPESDHEDTLSPVRKLQRSMTQMLKPSRRDSNHGAGSMLGSMLVESLLPEAERPQYVRRSSTSLTFTEDGSMDDRCSSKDRASRRRMRWDSEQLGNAAAGGTASIQPMLERRNTRSTGKFSQTLPSRSCHTYHKVHDMSSRIIDRGSAFGQSRGHWNIYSIGGRNMKVLREISDLFLGDWYHAFLDTKIHIQLGLFFGMYVACFGFFAALYLLISDHCGLDLDGNFIKAYILSVETMMTIGYGVPDPYMDGCWQGAFVLTWHVLLQLVMSAFLIGVIFQGISRPQARACTILFSERAVIRYIDGAHYLMFRVCDLRTRHSLIEAHLRLYCVHRHPVHGFKATAMRIDNPDDDLGCPLLLTLPQLVVHRIDAWSPLAPQHELEVAEVERMQTNRALLESAFSIETPGRNGTFAGDAGDGSVAVSPIIQEDAPGIGLLRHEQVRALRHKRWPTSCQRQADSETGNRDSYICPFCGNSCQTKEMLEIHCEYNEQSDIASGLPPAYCHRTLKAEDLKELGHVEPSREDIEKHLADHYLEVVCLVEGIEPTTSSTVQARHSYIVGTGPGMLDDDITWDRQFAECCRVTEAGSSGLGLDLGRFHLLQPETH